MKLKTLLLSAVVFMTGFIISCSDKDVPEEKVYKAEMTSFGFYVEDNEGVILEDYVVSPIPGATITLQLPEEIDKSSLVARFVVSENDVVKVGNTVQESGVTKNNFTIPVDYIVSEETANVKYTVVVDKAPAYVWSALPPVTADSAIAIVMKVSPAGVPYLAYKMKREVTDDEALGMMVMKDGVWTSMGQVSNGRVDTNIGIAFNSKDQPAVSYPDYTNTISRQASVKAYNGTSWNFVGSKEITTDRISYNALEYVDDSKLMLLAYFEGRNGPLLRRELSVNTFEGDKWVTNTTIPGRPADHRGWLVTSVKMNDAIYVGVHNAVSPNSVSVYKYQNNTWTTLLDAWADPKATGISLRDLDIDVDKKGNVYVALVDDSSEETFKHRIIKYNAETKQIENVGNPFTNASGGIFNFDLAVSPLGVPYLFFLNESAFPTIVSLDKDSQDWTAPHVLEADKADDLQLDFAPDGRAYLSYLKGRKIFSYKYDAPAK